jgi:octaprenyl-diphosphate synthase
MAMERGTEAERSMVRQAIVNGEIERLSDIAAIVRRTGALEATRDAARTEARKAQMCLAGLDAGPAKSALLELCVRSVERSS